MVNEVPGTVLVDMEASQNSGYLFAGSYKKEWWYFGVNIGVSLFSETTIP